MKTRLSAILVDIDSTLYACNPIFLKYLRERHDLHLDEADIDSWDFWRNHGVSLEQWLDLIETCLHSDAEIAAAVPYPGAVEALRDWSRSGVDIHVVSARKPSTGPATEAWLRVMGVPFTALAFDFSIDKLLYAQDNGLGLVIDDKPSFLAECAAAGLPAATIRHAYNAKVLEANPQIVAADDWRQLRHHLEEKFAFGSHPGPDVDLAAFGP